MTFCRLASFERIEVSIIREPTLTTRPPIRLSSTVTSSSTSLPTLAFRVFASASAWASVSGLAAVTSAVTSPRSAAIRRLELRDQVGHHEEPAVLRHQAEGVREHRAEAHRARRSRAIARPWSSRV